MPQQALPRLQLVKIAPLAITVPRQPSPSLLAVPPEHTPLSTVCPFATRAPQAATALASAPSPPTATAPMLQVATCTNALRAASSIKTSVPRRQQDISVLAAAATAPRPPTRSCLAHRARSLRMLVLCPTTLALFVPRLHIAPKVPPKVIRAQQAHSTRRKVNPLATAVRLVNTATPPPVKGLQHVLYAHPAVTTTERVSLSARRVRPAVRAVPQEQSPQRLVPLVSIKANGARRRARLALRAVHAHQILSRPKFVRPGILLPAAHRHVACVIKAITPARQALPPAPLVALASTLPLPAQLLPAAVPSTSTRTSPLR